MHARVNKQTEAAEEPPVLTEKKKRTQDISCVRVFSLQILYFFIFVGSETDKFPSIAI